MLSKTTSTNDFSFWAIQKNNFNCVFKLTSSCSSKNYFQHTFPDFYSICFHGFYSREKWEVCQSLETFFQGSIQFSSKKVFRICLQSLSNLNKLSFLMISLLENFLNCLFKLKSSYPSKNYFPQSFPVFYSICFHGFYSDEKWEVFQHFRDFFQGSKKDLSSEKSIYLLKFLSNFKKPVFLMISLFQKSKKSFLNCLFKLKSSYPSKNYFPQYFPDFYSICFHGFYSGEKWKVYQYFRNFFQGSKDFSSEKSVYNLFTIYITF